MADNPIRSRRLRSAGGSLLMVPMDHGISMGPLPGISPPGPTLDAVAQGASCVTVHKGLVPHVAPYADRLGILLHLSASTDRAPDPDDKRLVATVAEAARLGCDGVSSHLNLGAATEADMVAAVGAISTACQEHSMPHIAMVYPRGPGIDDPFRPDLVAHAARLGAELGADAVKVPYCDQFGDVVKGAGIPVIVAGGPKTDDMDAFLRRLQAAKDAGAQGVSIGRNVFASDDPATVMQRISDIFP